MSTRALVQGTYSDLRVVKGRKVLQVVVELPLEAADQFVSLFGMPNPSSEVPVALARLVTEAERGDGEAKAHAEPEAEKPRRGRSATQQAGIYCAERAFRTYLNQHWLAGVNGEGEAAEFVRQFCRVTSRAELDHCEPAAARWRILYDGYQAWLAAPRAGVAA